MTSSEFAVMQGQRVRANWPALLLPLVGFLAFGVGDNAALTWLVIASPAVAKHAAGIFARLGLAQSDDDNRRVLAVLAYLNS